MANGQERSVEVTHVYHVKRLLFSRGLARTYLAIDEHLEDEVLIERVDRTFDPEEADWLRQYRSVAVKLMRLRHPNHVAVRDFWTDERTTFFLVKQHDAGTTLDVLLRPEQAPELSPDSRAKLCKDLLRGLAALHTQNVLHRDVKPYGVYVCQEPDTRAQLDHFHLAVSAADVYLDDQLCGTPLYMAPELIRKAPRPYSRQSDVYAAGLVCLEILSGKGIDELLGIEGIQEQSLLSLLGHLASRDHGVRSETLRRLLPDAQAEVISCAIHPDPRERFADAQCFYDAFALRAPLRIARHVDPANLDNLTGHLERLPESGYRTDLLSAYRIAPIDARMALGKCQQIAETIARELYAAHVREPKTKPLMNLVDELADRKLLPPDVFTHFYNIRRQGDAAMHGGEVVSDSVLTILGAAVQIVTWYLLRNADNQ